MKQHIFSGTKWESIVGYSRAVRVGPHVHISGTTAVDREGNIVGIGDAYEQTRFILQKIQKALQEAGGDLKDVVRTRIYVVNIDDWEEVGRAHGEYLREAKPASTMVEVVRLVKPEMLVEIDADAFLGDQV